MNNSANFWNTDSKGALFLSTPFILMQFQIPTWLLFVFIGLFYSAWIFKTTQKINHFIFAGLILIFAFLNFGYKATPTELYSNIKISGTVQKIQHALDHSNIELKTFKGLSLRLKIETNNPQENTLIRSIYPGDSLYSSEHSKPLYRNSNPGGFDYATWLSQNKFNGAAKLKFSQIQTKAPIRPNWLLWFERATQKLNVFLSNKIDSHFSDSKGLINAMLLGNSKQIEKDLKDNFRKAGVAHLLAISGYHIALIVVILQLFIGVFTKKPWLKVSLTTLILLGYIPLCGGSPSVKRATVFYLLYALSVILQRKNNSLQNLYSTALILLWLNPLHILSIGFQLSFGATFGILTLFKNSTSTPSLSTLNPIFTSILIFFKSSLKLTSQATLGTLPILIHHFESVQLYSFITNLFLLIPTSMMLISSIPVLLIPSSWQTVSLLTSPFITLSDYLAQLLFSLTHLFSSLPFSEIHVPSNLTTTIPLILIVITLAYNKVKYSRIILFLSLLTLGQSLIFNERAPKYFEVHFFDVNQGDATLLRDPSGVDILIDAGILKLFSKYPKDMGKQVLEPALKELKTGKLDALIITHPDLDHYGGAIYLLEHWEVKNLYLPMGSQTTPKKTWLKLIQIAKSTHTPIHFLDINDHIKISDKSHLKVLHPRDDENAFGNEESIILKLEHRTSPKDTQSVIFMGDAGLPTEEKLVQNFDSELKADFLKIGHHGSKNSSSLKFLEHVNPTDAFISVGKYNNYGHPHPRVLKALNKLNIKFWDTRTCGSTLLSLKDSHSTVKCYKSDRF